MEQLLEPFMLFLVTQRRVAQNTALAYRRDVAQFLKFRAKKRKAARADLRMLLIDFRDLLLRSGTGARSLARKLSGLRSFFRYIGEFHPQEIKLQDPDAIVGAPPRIERRLPRICSVQDIEALIKAAQEEKQNPERAELICYLLYTAGLRVSELVTLRRDQINEATAMITVVGKGGKMRTIPLIEPTKVALQKYDAVRVQKIPKGKDRRLLTCTRQAVWHLLKRLAHRAQISTSVSPHVLRHALATHSLEEGWDLRSLQMFLGHERIATTEMYIHLDTRFVRSEYRKRHPRG